MIINLPKDLEKETTHRYGANSFKLHRCGGGRGRERALWWRTQAAEPTTAHIVRTSWLRAADQPMLLATRF